MEKSGSFRGVVAALGMMLAVSATAQVEPSRRPDRMFHQGFERVDAGPFNDADAARFLAQASFGATTADIQRLRQLGYAGWLAEQQSLPMTRELEYLDWVASTGEPVYQNARVEAWWLGALGGPDPAVPTRLHGDQLRQRVAFALSEIFVISKLSGAVSGQVRSMSQYYDMLAQHAFGNYRDLLEAVTLHPAMGHYLSMFKNRKPDLVANIRPDENYAREILQLFSIGLVQLNADGTPQLAGGQPLPTYGQTVVRGFAHVFTGWNWKNCYQGNSWDWEFCEPGPNGAYWLEPMEPVADYHDTQGPETDGSGLAYKQLLDYPGVALPSGRLYAGGTARSDLQAALDNIFHHPNVGPFLARQLIQRLVTSNPTPAYVGRVAAVFANNGSGVRGDLGAVVRAILLDREARYGLYSEPDRFGKVREPLLRLTHLRRALDARAGNGRFFDWNPEFDFAQAPLASPSVFNFFKPDYSPPGELAGQGMVAPELQIHAESQITAQANALGSQVFWGYVGQTFADETNILINSTRDTALAENPAALVERYDLLFLSGQMSPWLRERLVAYLQTITANSVPEYRRQRVHEALYLILNSPEYAVQK
ncbi:DUF1800 domain-containing protein [Tahibacter amnicola]|uniref:DUF1800 domain-containing protein n=1 Tax=Tahibacter amnicola TaxID=2976241 RepID=A0ABY6BH88_9GAMM|nr:DUF1800 domain-containing protein [Tahibacter amnicola]UXI67227.1 DUF1800 domain-containing protein [Tahibacter amnicola]